MVNNLKLIFIIQNKINNNKYNNINKSTNNNNGGNNILIWLTDKSITNS